MRTVDKILEYHLTELEINHLFISWIINWCWAKGWINFDKIIEWNIRLIPMFNNDKARQLFQDIRQICYEHDLDFRFKKWFYKSNYKFARKLYRLLREAKIEWVTKGQAWWISTTAFYLLNKNWKPAYNLTKTNHEK